MEEELSAGGEGVGRQGSSSSQQAFSAGVRERMELWGLHGKRQHCQRSPISVRAPQFKPAAIASQLVANVTDLGFISVASSKQTQISAPSTREAEAGRATCRVTSVPSVHSAWPRGRCVFYSTTSCGEKNPLQITASATMTFPAHPWA